MRFTTLINGSIPQLRKRFARDRVALCRFHNTVYLGCVIGSLLGVQLCHAAVTWPRHAWQERVRTRALRLSGDLVSRAVTRVRNQMRIEHVDATEQVSAS